MIKYSVRYALVFLLCIYFFTKSVFAQAPIKTDSVQAIKKVRPKDIFDVLSKKFKRKIEIDTLEIKTYENHDSSKATVFSLLPYINYSLATRWAFGGMVSNYYYLDKKYGTNLSTTDILAVYTFREQLIIRAKSTIWPKANKYNFVGDWRFMKYPSFTFGLGPNTSFKDRVLINYNYIRIYQNVFKELYKSFYAGLGYKIDYHYNVKQLSTGFVSDFDRYLVGNQNTTVASGPTVNLLYDSRGNLMNPIGNRFYGYLSYRYNTPFLGSNNEWQSLIIDVRKYVKLPLRSTNVLAFWSYNWLTFGGNPAYLDLPSTGWDANDNQGRGYIQGRFRSSNLVSFETEYRFSITRNKVLGGVIFGSVQSVSNLKTFDFETAYPAIGSGIRLKINKFTNTNLSIDFAIGVKGAKSVFFNLGEIF